MPWKMRAAAVGAGAALAMAGAFVVFELERDSGSANPSVPLSSLRAASSRSAAADTTPAAHRSDQAVAVAVPVLMYHVIAPPPAGAPLPELFVDPVAFAGQMAWLDRHGFHVVTLRKVWDSWHGAARLPSRPIVVSFDDGYRSAVATALPVLARHGWPGVLNLTVKHVGSSGLRPRGVRRLIAAGWEIDAHSITHADLTSLAGAALEREVAGSRSAIHRAFGVPVDFFCYPAGRYDDSTVAAVRRAGFLGATTTEFGLARASEPFTLDRVRVEGSDGVAGLAAKLRSLGR